MPSRDLNVALLPLDIRLEDRDWNLKMIADRISRLPSSVDLVLLPELATTGFGEFKSHISSLAEGTDGPTIDAMKRLSEENGVAICGGYIRADVTGYYNSCFFVADGRLLGIYDKRHLFAGAESRVFTPGDSLPPIIEYKSWKLRPVICYDLRFPVWNRAHGHDYDVMLLIANWPKSRYYAWKHLIIARAIENQVYVAACNREGEDIYGVYGRGDSLVVNALGCLVGKTLEDGSEVARLDFETFNNDRKTLQPWRMADKFTIGFSD